MIVIVAVRFLRFRKDSVYAQCTGVVDIQTDRQTDGRKTDINSEAFNYYAAFAKMLRVVVKKSE